MVCLFGGVKCRSGIVVFAGGGQRWPGAGVFLAVALVQGPVDSEVAALAHGEHVGGVLAGWVALADVGHSEAD
jgi:hypothetical protein